MGNIAAKAPLEHLETGKLGEDLACKYLKDRNFAILDRNYNRRRGEVDIIAQDTVGKVHFVEVKTVSHETREILEREVTRETWQPEDLVDEDKLRQIHKGVQTWLNQHNYQGEFSIDVIAIRLVSGERLASVNYLENVILE